VNVRIEQKAMTVATVDQTYYEVDRRYKIEALTRLIDLHDLKLGIIFCNTKRMVDDLVDHLNAQGYSADRLHGDMNQAQRDRVMLKFRKSGLEFLVATDVAARGIDVDDVEVVFNYDLPYDGEDYVHRIGRTGRKGRAGRAITFVSGREVFAIRHIERYTNTRIQRGRVPSVGEVEEARTDVFLGKIRATLAAGKYQAQQPVIERLLEEGFASTDIAAAILHHLKNGSSTDEPAEKPVAKPVKFESANAATGNEPDVGRPAPRPARAERPPAPTERRAPDRPAPRVIPKAAGPVTAAPLRERPPVRDRAPIAPAPFAGKASFNQRAPAPRPVKASRATPKEQTRLFINVGAAMGVQPGDIVGAILGETGLPSGTVGIVDIRERHLFVDVSSEHAPAIISKLNRARIKGNSVKVKVA
jgi:ATP-dependent RNA helicase DeaD